VKTYTVLLLYPDYLAETFGQETFLACIKAKTVQHAIQRAQKEAFKANPGYRRGHDLSDFYPLITLEGEHQDITPQ
jgi:hypothetical protein